jgi:PKD repeat protein
MAALLKSQYPGMDKWDMDTLIMNTTDNIDAQNPSYVGLLGTGRINAYNAMHSSTIVNFDAHPHSGPAPLTVEFTDQSPATISRLWDFGDGGSSTDEIALHEYTSPGLYDVSLEVTDSYGTLTKEKRYFIHAMSDTVYGD